jgi:hypothetical protein
MAHVSDRGESRSDTSDGHGFALLQCPRCGGSLGGGSLGEAAARRMECERCHTAIQVLDGIVDFVAGASSTELDNLDYDQFYSISEAASEHLFDIIGGISDPLHPGRRIRNELVPGARTTLKFF